MRYLSLAVILAAMPAYGQNSPFLGAPDEWTLDVHSAQHATVQYYNSAERNSGAAPGTLTSDGLTVEIDLEITQGPEFMTVTPPEGWLAVPPTISVEDGEIGTVDLIRVEEWQGM
jgi:hypothetical protein